MKGVPVCVRFLCCANLSTLPPLEGEDTQAVRWLIRALHTTCGRAKDYALHLFMRLHDVSLLFVCIVKYVTHFLDLIEVPSLIP